MAIQYASKDVRVAAFADAGTTDTLPACGGVVTVERDVDQGSAAVVPLT